MFDTTARRRALLLLAAVTIGIVASAWIAKVRTSGNAS
jgi:hypothetical protein